MNLLVGALITFATSAIAIAAMLAVRRRAPDGGHFKDGDRAAGVFGVLATGFAVTIGFVVFLSFTTYDESRSGAEAEAIAVLQLFETAQLMPEEVQDRLSGEVICYGRSVIGLEWPTVQRGAPTESINPWGLALFRTLETVDPDTATEQSAFDSWLEHTSAREEARRDRLHAAEGIIPSPLWLVLFFAAAVIFVFMLFFADSGEGPVVQAMMMGSVTAVIVTLLVLLSVLERPYQEGAGGLQPIAMTRSLRIIDDASAALGIEVEPPCDASGTPA